MTISPVLKNRLLLDELLNHPYWKQNTGDPSGLSLKIKSLEIIEDTQNTACFQLCLHLSDGKTLLAPFWTDVSLGKWCFQNGQPHIFSGLPEMFSEILHHLEKGEVLVSPSQNDSQ